MELEDRRLPCAVIELAYCYGAYGLRIRSALALPFFDPLPDAGAADVSVRLGAVPRTLPGGTGRPVRDGMWQARPGAFLLQMEGVARYLIADGREVYIEPIGGDHADIASLLAGLWTVLLQQRGVVPLHAAAVRTTAGALLLIGRSGHGKSSLAAALVERGHALLADDVSGLALRGGRVTALPSFASLRLWKPTLKKMGASLKVRSRVRPGVEKFWVEASSACTQALPVCAAVVLKPSHRADIYTAPVSQSEAFGLLCEHTHRKRALRAMGQRPAHFRVVAPMARQVPMLRAWRPHHPFLLEELADHVEARVAELGAASAKAGAAPRRKQSVAAPSAPALPAPSVATTRSRAPGFVWIACWPKSGSTWLRTVITNCLRDDDQPASINALVGAWLHGRDEFDDYLGLDSSHMTEEETSRHLARFRAAAVEQLLAAAGPTFAKTHEAYRLPDGPPRFPRGGKVVYLMRNPLDVAVSYARHLDLPVARTIQLMNSWQAHEGLDPDGIHNRLPEPMTTWSNHALSWIEQAELPVHVARYEDLLADPRAGFGTIARFAGLDLDDAQLERAIEHSAFHRLQAQEAESGFKEKQPTGPAFFRAGTAGQWRSELAPEQVRAIVDVHGDVMAQFDYLQEARQFRDAVQRTARRDRDVSGR